MLSSKSWDSVSCFVFYYVSLPIISVHFLQYLQLLHQPKNHVLTLRRLSADLPNEDENQYSKQWNYGLDTCEEFSDDFFCRKQTILNWRPSLKYGKWESFQIIKRWEYSARCLSCSDFVWLLIANCRFFNADLRFGDFRNFKTVEKQHSSHHSIFCGHYEGSKSSSWDACHQPDPAWIPLFWLGMACHRSVQITQKVFLSACFESEEVKKRLGVV